MKYTGHSHTAKIDIKAVILTISASRYSALMRGEVISDLSGDIIEEKLRGQNVEVLAREVINDDIVDIRRAILKWIDKSNLIITTGGTGVTPSDVTIEAVKPLLDKELTLFPILFAVYSIDDVGSSVLPTRSIAGVRQKTLIFCLPGSKGAVSLAMDRIVLPQIGHLMNMIYGLE